MIDRETTVFLLTCILMVMIICYIIDNNMERFESDMYTLDTNLNQSTY